jgi:hypothetical protein
MGPCPAREQNVLPERAAVGPPVGSPGIAKVKSAFGTGQHLQPPALWPGPALGPGLGPGLRQICRPVGGLARLWLLAYPWLRLKATGHELLSQTTATVGRCQAAC